MYLTVPISLMKILLDLPGFHVSNVLKISSIRIIYYYSGLLHVCVCGGGGIIMKAIQIKENLTEI